MIIIWIALKDDRHGVKVISIWKHIFAKIKKNSNEKQKNIDYV